MREFILATRASRLALIQAEIAADFLRRQGYAVRFLTVSTKGDQNPHAPLAKIGGHGLFVGALETVLLNGQADFAVHSGKDLPYELAYGLAIAGTPAAADPRDCLLWRKNTQLRGPVRIATGSPRRVFQCRKLYPDADFCDIRGNLDTRLQKLRDGFCDGLILAKAGLERLHPDLSEFDVRIFSTDEMIPAACQGIIAVECRENDRETCTVLEHMRDNRTWERFQMEREMFCLMRADCSAAMGVHCELQEENVTVSVLFQGKRVRKTGPRSDYRMLCREILTELH